MCRARDPDLDCMHGAARMLVDSVIEFMLTAIAQGEEQMDSLARYATRKTRRASNATEQLY